VELEELGGLVEAPPGEAVERQEGQEGVRAALACLAPDDRLVVLLFYYEERRQHEIAAMLGIPVGTVKSRLHHALKRLKGLLAEEHPDG
jgi:RNA polymerase sigma-70 factor (ECF subfamily)